MFQGSKIFEENYQQYLGRLAGLDLGAVADRLGGEYAGHQLRIPFFGRDYLISREGMTDAAGNRPRYAVCVILAKYLLLCPEHQPHAPEWVSFKDFKRTSHFTNVNFFTSDTEQVILKRFSGKLADLARAGERLGGRPGTGEMAYDLGLRFTTLPQIDLLLLFNDSDAEFPAQCTVLFQKQAEFYLDPESLAMTGALLARRLVNGAPAA